MWEQTFLGKFMQNVKHRDYMQGGRKNLTNAFSSNLNTVNLRTFPDHGERHTFSDHGKRHSGVGDFM